MLACVCGGILEAILLCIGCGITAIFTSIYNRCKKPCCKQIKKEKE